MRIIEDEGHCGTTWVKGSLTEGFESVMGAASAPIATPVSTRTFCLCGFRSRTAKPCIDGYRISLRSVDHFRASAIVESTLTAHRKWLCNYVLL